MKIINKFIKNGTKFILPNTCVIDNTVWLDNTSVIGKNCEIIQKSCVLDNSYIDNSTLINVKAGKNCIIKNSYLSNCEIKDGTVVNFANITDSCIGSGCKIGPFCVIRERSNIKDNCRIGSFVEIKKSKLENGVKSAHLTYIGDASVGENTNIGCGVVFANYNGKLKQKTSVGKNCFVGANVNLIAPLTLQDNCYIGAGTTISKDLENNKFVVSVRNNKITENLLNT